MTASPSAAEAPAAAWNRDRSFWGMTLTQFLGAFNDNIFKQLLLLLCVDVAQGDVQRDQQGTATILFAAPFILFSGFAGFLADRYSKRTIVVLCKLAEVAIALAGMAAFAWGGLSAPLAVLFLMGTHSAFFGPPKYGILPELFAEHDLPRVNGVVLMTTFLAIILALPTAGWLKEQFTVDLWRASQACVGVALLGTATALIVRRTPAARPGLAFHSDALFVERGAWRAVREKPELLRALLASSTFWLAGGVVYPNVTNAVGKLQFGLDDFRAGLLAACTAVGIVVGCLTAGLLSKDRFRADLVRLGMWGMLATLLLLAIPGPGFIERELDPSIVEKLLRGSAAESTASEASTRAAGADSTEAASPPVDADAPPGDVAPQGVSAAAERPKKIVRLRPVLAGVYGSGVLLMLLGVSAGLFSVPVQVYLQARSPADQKGRIIGVMNLFNWIGIGLAGGLYGASAKLLSGYAAPNLSYAAAAAAIVPLLGFYRPRSEVLQ